jgi:glycine/D-amino acid oxidase-like deaminating enzyme
VSTAVVVGAGVFGVSTARELSRRGFDVRVVEQYSPGNVRSGSGGDSRLIRWSHGDVDWYTLSARRALTLWRELEAETGAHLLERCGLAWFETGDDEFTRKSEAALRRLGIPCERLSPEESRKLFPSLGTDDLRSTLYEPDAGVLHARLATQCLARGLAIETGRATPHDPPGADVVVWACGSWLDKVFPAVVDLRVSRRDEFYFGADGAWTGTPGYCDYAGPYYGHGELGGLGVKVAFDGGTGVIDPDELERRPDPVSEERARTYLARRFPSLARAPLIGSRVCQYDLTPDSHFIFSRHPERADWWLLGGGSGHGFEGKREPESFHRLGARTGNAGLRTASTS